MSRYRPEADTFKSTRAAVAKRVLSSPVASAIGYDHRLHTLQAVADGAETSTWSFLSVTFRRAGTNVDLEVRAEEIASSRRDYDQDADGNDYTGLKLTCTVNWPCHGSTDVAVALARMELYRQVALLGAEIQGEFGEEVIWRLDRTKAQREEHEAKQKEEIVKGLVFKAMESVKSNFRVGSPPRPVTHDLAVQIPEGTYKHQFADGKEFTLVAKEGIALVSRDS